jgi:hypothetical protein
VMAVFYSLLLSWLLALRLVVLRLLVLLLRCHLPHHRLFLLLLMVRVVVFIVLIVITMDMKRSFAIGRRKVQARRSSQSISGTDSGGSERSSTGSETQEILMLLRRLAASTSSGIAGTVTQYSALIGSATDSQSSTLGPPTVPSPGTYSWYLNFGAFFHMTHHSAHLSSLRPSSRHCIVHTADGSPLSIAR